ncbi:glucuronate isomerase, partial [Paenibacillus sepulcri]|nr:glucuronate isomerase [Paenibacillus sepulcri]
YHIKLKEDSSFDTVVLPSFRPDKSLEINRATFRPWIARLSEAAGHPIGSYGELLSALESRIQFFDSVGCRVSDHALDYVPYADTTEEEAAEIFAKALQGAEVSLLEEQKYKTHTLLFLGRQYNKLGWAMQLHINASRNNNSLMFGKLGPDTGYDSINDSQVAYPLTRLLDALNSADALPKTILYSLDPVNYPVLATVMGSFQGGGVAGKMQLGSAWWYNDTKDGMLVQMNTLANIGLLSRFVGMLTDSRSFLSYTRHEYFRRLLCDMLGDWVEKGEAPHDRELLGTIVQDICYNNAQQYFGFAQ